MKVFFPIALGLVAINAGATVCNAQQGVELWDQVPPASPVHVLSKHNLFTEVVNEINEQRGQIDKTLAAALGRPDMIHKGVTLYKMNLKLGTGTIKFLDRDTLRIDIPKNYCYFRSTTPTALGKYADPALELHFDVRLTVTLHLPTVKNPRIAVKKADVTVPHLEIKARNFVADVGVTVAHIVDFFAKAVTGKSLIQTAFQHHLPVDVTKALDSRVKPINKTIEKIVKEGFTPTAKLSGQQLIIVLVNSKQALTKEGDILEREVLKRARLRPPATTPGTPTPTTPDNGR
jgi:hypothetical protein